MGDVWFYDLSKALKIFQELFPNIHTFQSIQGSYYGDFIIITSNNTYLINHFNFDIYHQVGDGEWKLIKTSKS